MKTEYCTTFRRCRSSSRNSYDERETHEVHARDELRLVPEHYEVFVPSYTSKLDSEMLNRLIEVLYERKSDGSLYDYLPKDSAFLVKQQDGSCQCTDCVEGGAPFIALCYLFAIGIKMIEGKSQCTDDENEQYLKSAEAVLRDACAYENSPFGNYFKIVGCDDDLRRLGYIE